MGDQGPDWGAGDGEGWGDGEGGGEGKNGEGRKKKGKVDRNMGSGSVITGKERR